GREVRLAGIERGGADLTSGRAALAAIAVGRDVTLHGDDDTPDRYGRQAAFATAERTARDAKLGIWAHPSAIKNAESSGDILAAIGHFTVVEGRVLSV